jgi:hypothetical protein
MGDGGKNGWFGLPKLLERAAVIPVPKASVAAFVRTRTASASRCSCRGDEDLGDHPAATVRRG